MQLNKYIDHTLLKQDASVEQITKLCEEAKEFDFASVCVNPGYVKLCASLLKETDVKVCTVIGFPLGATDLKTKAFEAKTAIKNGASEIDMVVNVGLVKSNEYDAVLKDIEAVRKATKGYILKVILETCLLTKEEIQRLCRLCVIAKADFVKTSTGFSSGGATIEDVALMSKTVDGKCLVKASGGIRDKESALAMIEAGANRIGTSAGVKICS